MKKERGQIWVETVIYTLITFIIIGLVLSFVKPKLEEFQDKSIIEQSISMMREIDGIITEIKTEGVGNQRVVELGIKKGIFKIDSGNDTLIFELQGRYTYSEPGKTYQEGNLFINTEKKGELSTVSVSRKYTNNITYDGKDELKTINKAATPYKLFISNKGGDNTVIDIGVS